MVVVTRRLAKNPESLGDVYDPMHRSTAVPYCAQELGMTGRRGVHPW